MIAAITAGLVLLGTIAAFGFSFWKSKQDEKERSERLKQAATEELQKEAKSEGQESMDKFLNIRANKRRI